jgi:hypothetical protein
MQSLRHHVLAEVFKGHPEFAAKLLRDEFGLDLPGYVRVREASPDLTDAMPTERHADVVVAFAGAEDSDKPVLAVVVEVQLRRDNDKHWTWPLYLAKVRARLRCRVALLVITVNAATARWCAKGIDVGYPGWVLHPLVYGPDRVPVVTDPRQVTGVPELALLSAMVHGNGPQGAEIVHALAACLAETDAIRAGEYSDMAFSVLPEAARKLWEEIMATPTYQYQHDYARRLLAEGEVKGEAKGEATAVLEVLDERGFAVSDEVRARVTGCSDLDQLRTWLRRAVKVHSAEELFE